MIRIQRGSVCLADLNPPKGTEPGKIRPVLVDNCFKCHTGKKPKADLLLEQLPIELDIGPDPLDLVAGHPPTLVGDGKMETTVAARRAGAPCATRYHAA